MKKAYILAKHDALHSSLADRFVAMFFLATPHRGADSAKLLKKILRLAYDRAYIGDLNPGSPMIQIINDDFRHVSANLKLWSFYETQHLKHFGSLVVEPESALLGYREEKQVPMAADHRSICKFDARSDANYILLRNALASTVTSGSEESNAVSKSLEMKQIGQYLEISDVLDDDFSSLCDMRWPSSCQWILKKENFVSWRSHNSIDSNIFWVTGNPASGKSILASSVIEDLQDSGEACSFFFFKHGDEFKSNAHQCLRKLAYQMADLDSSCRRTLKEKESDGIQLEHMNERSIWKTLFHSGMLKHLARLHYIVIDGLDECSDGNVFFDTILPSVPQFSSLRLLIMSRETLTFTYRETSLNSPLSFIRLSLTDGDTLPDLRTIVGARIRSMGIVPAGDHDSLVSDILMKSKGSFLWTCLVLEELASCHTTKEIGRVLDDVPKGMESLYKRTLKRMELLQRGKTLAKAILRWTACSIRPMTVSELDGALRIDMQDTFPQLRGSIRALCGQLVAVDKADRVQMIHETARGFLLDASLESEFSINSQEAHTHMARVCLSYLTSDEMKPPRVTRHRSFADSREPFATYAYYAYSYHLSKANASCLDLFELLWTFLKSNVLTWIEAMAGNMTLKQLIRSGNHLRTYGKAYSTEHSHLSVRAQQLQQWPRDLTRLTTVFGRALTSSPSAIYSLIPPLCPRSSRIYCTTLVSRRLKVVGSFNTHWDDRLLVLDFDRGQPSAMSYGEEFLAVGLTTGTIYLYYLPSYQQYRILDHGERVGFIAFMRKTSLLATCGQKFVKLWNLQTGVLLHDLQSPSRPLDMQFHSHFLTVASQKNHLVSWDISDDGDLERTEKLWTEASRKTEIFGTATVLALSFQHRMLAVAYTGRPITVWDIDEFSIIGTCGKKWSSGETSTHPVVSLVFNRDPSVALLAATYLDGNLALLDPLEDRELECLHADCQALAASPNGRLLVAGAADGVIQVFEFDTLKLVYKAQSQSSFIKSVCFTKDSFIFADIRRTRCTVWEPDALLRDLLDDDSSGVTTNTVVETKRVNSAGIITVIAYPELIDLAFAGCDDGSVSAFSATTLERITTLYRHNVTIRFLKVFSFGSRFRLLSIDAASRIFMYDIGDSGEEEGPTATMIFQTYIEDTNAVTGLLLSDTGAKFLISTLDSDYLFDAESGCATSSQCFSPATDIKSGRQWALHPTNDAWVVCLDRHTIKIYSWADLSEIRCQLFELGTTFQELPRLKQVMLYRARDNTHRLLAMLSHSSTGGFIVGTVDNIGTCGAGHDSTGGPTRAECAAAFQEIRISEMQIVQIFGIDESGALIFINESSWVCSVDLSEQNSTVLAKRHFFLPQTWFAGGKQIVCTLTRKDILLARDDKLAMVEKYKEFDYT